MNNDIKFSVVVVVYNQADYIKETIESILNQTYQNFEVIISDDCSADNLHEVLKDINDDRVKYFRTSYNMGINANISNGCVNSTGDYLVLLGGDDKLRPNHLEKMLETFSNNDVDVVYCHISSINEKSEYILGKDVPFAKTENRSYSEFLHDFFAKNLVASPGMTLKKDAMLSLIPMNVSIVNYSDVKMHIDLLINGYKILVLKDILVDYRQFSDERNISSGKEGITDKRCFLETKPLMDSYLRLTDVELLENVFKSEIEKTGIKPYPNTIPFFLGQMALLTNDDARQMWGYQTIAEFMSIKDNYNLVHDLYGFTFKNLLDLPKRIKTKSEYLLSFYKKYEKYKKLFNLFLVISIILVIINILLWIIFAK